MTRRSVVRGTAATIAFWNLTPKGEKAAADAIAASNGQASIQSDPGS